MRRTVFVLILLAIALLSAVTQPSPATARGECSGQFLLATDGSGLMQWWLWGVVNRPVYIFGPGVAPYVPRPISGTTVALWCSGSEPVVYRLTATCADGGRLILQSNAAPVNTTCE